MTKSNKQEYFKKVVQKTLEPHIIQFLKSKDFSKTYALRDDQKEIRNEIKMITEKAAEILVQKMSKKGFLEKTATPKEFKELLEESVKEALETNEPNNKFKDNI